MYKMRIYLIAISVLLVVSCVRKNNQGNQSAFVADQKVFEVAEVIHTNSYSYLKVKEKSLDKWMAVAKQDIQVGDVYYYDEALQMTNFLSKDLDRTFDVIYFINQISSEPIAHNHMGHIHNHDHNHMHSHGSTDAQQKGSVSLEKAPNEISVAQIFANLDEYSGKEIEIRGIVVKVNKGIMGKNWIHIQDGTESNGKFDLTITSQDVAEVNEEVTFKGKITLNKDFGSGYFYEVIMEDAVLTDKAMVQHHNH
jgi:uncharacterized membrane protein YcgQ (UPF0703/DUF1980 family)